MTRDEYQAQHVVTDVVVHGSSKIGHLHFALGHFAAKHFMLFIDEGAAPEEIDSSMFRRSHEPCAGIFRNARFGPLFQCDHQSVLRKFFRDTDISYDASQPGNQAGRLDLPNGFDGEMCFGSSHCYRSHHFQASSATSATWFVQGASAPCS